MNMNVKDGTTSSNDKSSSSTYCSSSSSSSSDKHPAQSTVDYGPLPFDVPGKAKLHCCLYVYSHLLYLSALSCDLFFSSLLLLALQAIIIIVIIILTQCIFIIIPMFVTIIKFLIASNSSHFLSR